MPVYSIKEFASLVGKEPKQIHTAAVRGKVIKNDKKQIDTSVEVNQYYLDVHGVSQPQNKLEVKEKKVKKPPKVRGYRQVVEEIPEAVEAVRQGKLDLKIPTHQDLIAVDYQKKLKEVEKLKKDIAIKEEDLKKKRNEVVDLEHTLAVVKAYSDSMKKDVTQQMQMLIQDICARYGVDSGKAGRHKLKVIEIVNQCSKKSISLLLEQFKDE